MKKAKTSLIVFVIIIMVPMLLVGCKPEMNSDQSAKVWFNYIVKGDMTNLSKIGVTKEKANKLRQTQKVTYKNALKTGFESGNLKIEDKQTEQMYQAYIGGLDKVSVTTQIVSQTSKYSQVKLKSTYIMNTKADSQKTIAEATKQVKTLKLTNEKEYSTKVLKIFINALIKEYKNAKVSNVVKEKTYKFIITDKRWTPQDPIEFANDVVKTSLGQ
ncbi:hypothetical protein [Clostridium psychrophilum]|uniref:hypothetical protein n=1 Tax=Clostridium psychrophilum TaxID=132926 RepID=UPI001C0AAE39|nr:hypothetical protein [Clostridium psychrophilum]MBU3181060.1 hypothetical protein [Clostridium psychrophilum]